MRSIVSIRRICSLGSGRRSPLFSSNRSSAQRPTLATYRTTAAMANAAHDSPRRRPMIGGLFYAPAGTEIHPDVIELARFAVAEHNTKANAALEFERVVKVGAQQVGGIMHYFTIEVKEGGDKKLYEAKVWVRVWENFKGLHEFKPVA